MFNYNTNIMWSYVHRQRLPFSNKSKLTLQRSLSMESNDESKTGSHALPIEDSDIPEAPTTCCMSACPNCVWIEYANRMNEMFRDGGEKSLKIIEEKVADVFSVLTSNNYSSETNIIYVEENECSNASFLIASLLWEALSVHKAEVMEITFHNSAQHYQHLISKITQNLLNVFNEPKITNLNPTDFIDSDSLNVEKLLSSIRDFCEQRADANSVILIDDISYVYLLSSPNVCYHFIRYCSKLIATYPKLRIIIGCHTSSDDEELCTVSKFLHHCSKMNLIVTPLQSGFSSDVTGHLTVINRTRLESKINKYCYKIDDKKISINPYIL